MNILFIHQNFSGQFKHLAPALVRLGHAVSALGLRPPPGPRWHGVEVLRYPVARGTTPQLHPWVADFETKVIRAEAVYRQALAMRAGGYRPDVVIAHPGWGESLFVKDVWPAARLGVYCEFYYLPSGADVGFDPEFPPADADGVVPRLRLKNLNTQLQFATADAAVSPTAWQASTFPAPFRDRIRIVHDGIDTRHLSPMSATQVRLQGAHADLTLSRDDEVLTFVNRNLEPTRGFHTFMRALPEILRRRPRVQVFIVGGADVSYGARPDPLRHGGLNTWKAIFTAEVRPRIADADWARVHFVGKLAYPQFVSLLRLSTVHVYLTYPFVLSWSLLEAMSLGCAIVASDTAPVREAIAHDHTGRLVDFFDPAALADEVCTLLADPASRTRLGQAARAHAQRHYDLHTVCLPAQLAWVEALRA